MKLKSVVLSLLGVIGVILCVGWYFFAGSGYYRPLRAVEAALRNTPGVEIVSIGANEDVTLEAIWTTIRVKGRGEIGIYDITTDSFRGSDHFKLTSLGPYRFHHDGEGYVGVERIDSGEPVCSEFFGGSIDFGRFGEIPRKFPFELRCLNDLISHYDEALQFCDAWLRAGGSLRFTDSKTTNHHFYITRSDEGE